VGWRMAASVPTGHEERAARASRQVNVMAQAESATASFPVFQPRWGWSPVTPDYTTATIGQAITPGRTVNKGGGSHTRRGPQAARLG